MQIHLLLTSKVRATMPDTIKTIFSTSISIFELDKYGDRTGIVYGDNAILEGKKSDIINWLKEFDEIWVGNGIPQTEEFHKDSIKNDLK